MFNEREMSKAIDWLFELFSPEDYEGYDEDEIGYAGGLCLPEVCTALRGAAQAQSQLKAIYKDNSDTIIGNMDSRIFLGGSEPTTLKELNQALGKETIDTYNTSNTRGNSPSYGMNYQKLGKDLATVDELAVLDGGKCILQLRGVRPFLSDKYDLTQHPNYKYTSDFDKKNEFNIEQFLSRRLKLKAGDEFVVVDAD